MDHDRLFKELLRTFFIEFIELFLPKVAAFIERDSLEFLDKEVFTDVTAGDRHEVDLLAKVRFRGRPAFFLIHVETQSRPHADFAARMFRYFARLTEKHGLPVYPIVLFSHDAPRRPEPDHHRVEFPDKVVLDFRYTVIQLNRLRWRDFLHHRNPVASALMAKMDIPREDRPRVKLECLRLLVTLRLNRAKMHLISGFVDAYLRLSGREAVQYQQAVTAIAPGERKAIVNFVNGWEEQGAVKELHEAIERLLRRRFRTIPAAMKKQVRDLDADELRELLLAAADFKSRTDADAWFAARARRPRRTRA